MCITIFSAPNYCQSSNQASVMSLTADQKIDILTFEETNHKPFALASGQLAFECFQPHLSAMILDAIYNILKVGAQPSSLSELLGK